MIWASCHRNLLPSSQGGASEGILARGLQVKQFWIPFHDELYLDLHADPAIFETAVRALAEGNSIRATARIVQVDKDTACEWLDRAAQHCRLVMLYLWGDLHAIECQLDELWSFVHT